MTDASQQWTTLCQVDEIPSSGGHYVRYDNRSLAVFRSPGGQVHVLDDACPHAGASLSGGHIDNGCAICPWHGWAFNLPDGKCPDNPQIGVKSHRVQIDNGQVQVQLSRTL
jgi:nitrite reductase (NADH) small subunit